MENEMIRILVYNEKNNCFEHFKTFGEKNDAKKFFEILYMNASAKFIQSLRNELEKTKPKRD